MRKAVLLGVLIFLAMPSVAQAYLDPGTGSMILQMVVAGVMGGLFVAKGYWRRFVAFVTGRTADEGNSSSSDASVGDDRG